MKRILVFLAALLLMSGCIKTKAVMRERVDIEMSAGNRGTLMGTPPPSPTKIKEKRTVLELDVYIPVVEKYETKDKELSGNRGYLKRTGK